MRRERSPSRCRRRAWGCMMVIEVASRWSGGWAARRKVGLLILCGVANWGWLGRVGAGMKARSGTIPRVLGVYGGMLGIQPDRFDTRSSMQVFAWSPGWGRSDPICLLDVFK